MIAVLASTVLCQISGEGLELPKAWACETVMGGLIQVAIEQVPDTNGIEDFGGSIVSALRLLSAETGVADPASRAFLELSTALVRWQAREK